VDIFRDAVVQTNVEDVLLGPTSDPLLSLSNSLASILGAFEKCLGKICVIYYYILVENVVKPLKLCGCHCLMSKPYHKDVYTNIMVCPKVWHYLWSIWMTASFFVDHVLLFGLQINAMLFDLVVSALI
jgi:hypothetical protein